MPHQACPAVQLSYRRALIIEDDKDSAESLQEFLKVWGCEALIAESGSDGLRMAREIRPELVICDIGLPDLSGFRVAQEFRNDAEIRRVRLIGLSGYGDEEDRRQALNAGFDTYLVKPVRAAELLKQLQLSPESWES